VRTCPADNTVRIQDDPNDSLGRVPAGRAGGACRRALEPLDGHGLPLDQNSDLVDTTDA